MSAVMDVLLSDQRRMETLRAVQPATTPSRADRLIEEGDRRRLAYRRLSPNADAGMVYGAQIGYLHAQIRILCAEAEALCITRDSNLQYSTVDCPAASDVVVGWTYDAGSLQTDPGDVGGDESLELAEAWIGSVELLAVLSDDVKDQLEAAVLAKIHAEQAASGAMTGDFQ